MQCIGMLIVYPNIKEFEILALMSAWYGLESGDRIPVEARFFASVQTGPGAQPAIFQYNGHRVSFPGALTTLPDLAPRLKKEYSNTSPSPLGLNGVFLVNFTFTF